MDKFQCNNFFNTKAKWLGWIEEGQIWRNNGQLLGELYDNKYILISDTQLPPVPKVPPVPPAPTEPPVISEDIIDKEAPLKGFKDALDVFDNIDEL